jgi:diacylglycerol kinase family enzyme
MNERIAFIVNPRAQGGRAGDRLDLLRKAIDRAFGDWSLRVTDGPGHAEELAREAVDSGVDIVAAVGGDGTCSDVVNGMFAGDRPLSRRVIFTIVPWGTGSDLARSIRAPKSLGDALWVAATGMTLPADVGYLNYVDAEGRDRERVFINVAGFGANGDVVHRANRSSKRLGGRATFFKALVGTLANYKPGRIRLDWEGPDGPGTWEGSMLSTFVANGAFCGGGMWVGRGGSMHDGHLDLLLMPEMGLAKSLKDVWRLYDGSAAKVPEVLRARVRSLRAESTEPRGAPILLDVDGEQPGRLPVQIRVLPGALQIRGGWLASPLLPVDQEQFRPR